MDERYFSLGDAAETLSASIFDSEGNRMPVQEMFSAMQDAFLIGALTFYDDYKNPIDLDALKRQKWEFISLYDRDSNHLGLYGETTTPEAIDTWLESTGSPYRFPTANSASETQAAPVVAASDGPAPTNTIIHSTKARRDTLTPVIELAQKKCRNPKDTAEVWGVMQVLAEKKTAPLFGATDDGLQYLDKGNAAIFSRRSLHKRLTR